MQDFDFGHPSSLHGIFQPGTVRCVSMAQAGTKSCCFSVSFCGKFGAGQAKVKVLASTIVGGRPSQAFASPQIPQAGGNFFCEQKNLRPPCPPGCAWTSCVVVHGEREAAGRMSEITSEKSRITSTHWSTTLLTASQESCAGMSMFCHFNEPSPHATKQARSLQLV